jgi:hypothetical protein
MKTKLIAAITTLMMAGQPANAGKLTACAEFRSRLPQAEATLKMPIPKISFIDEGAVADYHDYSLADLQNFSADLRCRRDGKFDNFQIQQLGHDDYSAKRFVALGTAAIWAYTGWPVAKISATLSELVHEASQEFEATKIRGDKFKDGRASRELGSGVELQVSGGEFGLWMMIDASVAEDK